MVGSQDLILVGKPTADLDFYLEDELRAVEEMGLLLIMVEQAAPLRFLHFGSDRRGEIEEQCRLRDVEYRDEGLTADPNLKTVTPLTPGTRCGVVSFAIGHEDEVNRGWAHDAGGPNAREDSRA